MKFGGRVRRVSHEQMPESLAMLKLLARSQQSIRAGRYRPLKRAFADLTARMKNPP